MLYVNNMSFRERGALHSKSRSHSRDIAVTGDWHASAYCDASRVRLSTTFLSQFCKICAALNSALSIPCALAMPYKDYTLGF